MGVDSAHLFRDIDTLRTVRATLVAAYAVTCLTQFRHASVIAHEERTASTAEILVLNARRDITLVEALVVMKQNRRNVKSVRTRHAILAVVTRNRVILHHLGCRILQEAEIIGGKCLQRGVSAQIILKMLHACHAAE